MAAEPLPTYRYHPDPIATGSIEPSDGECEACGRSRGFVYAGPVYAEDELEDAFCPWCIADGSAAAAFDAIFTDDWGAPPDVPAAVVEEITRRTPGFSGWQQERWLYHCGDGCAFLGPVGGAELERYPDAVEMLRQEEVGDGLADYLMALSKDGSPTAYLFRCLHCGRHTGYSDCH